MFGAILADASIFVLFAWARFVAGIGERELWSKIYWQEPWQSLSAISNSVPLFASLAVVGLILRLPLLVLFALSVLAHLALDFPFHAHDAHRHFWPFSNWRFHSPLSYWDHSHFGAYVGMAEVALALALIVILWHRFQALWVRLALGVALATYLAVPAYFARALGGSN